LTLVIKKRGRPSKADLALRAAAKPKPKSNGEILEDLVLRFGMLGKLTQGALEANIRSIVVSGAPGVGKSYNVEQVLAQAPDHQYDIVSGSISAIGLYKMGWKHRSPGQVLVLDDADAVFLDPEALSLLKAMADTSLQRRVSWIKESAALRAEDGDIPTTYDFDGSLIFLSNIDFQRVIDTGGNKLVPHLEAVMGRSLYLDLQLFSMQARLVWIQHIATNGMLFRRESVNEATGARILAWLTDHHEKMRDLSIRSLVKLCSLAKSRPSDWPDYSRVLLLRS